YNRASRMVERMEREGLVTPPGSGGVRKVLARSQAEGGGVFE
ncbi:MAG TPA: DNA translocase FtsK, partial [Mariprofundaceae bacterium]|nr:DNA translocase FtsK [Mariprofundaceae bacterium]